MNCSPLFKFSLLVLNILCCISGLFVLLSSAYSLIVYNESVVIRMPCILEIVLSSILILNAFFGCYSTSGKSVHFILLYAVVMILLLIGQVTVVIFAPINFTDIDMEAINRMWKSDMQSQFMMTMYEIKYKCCGKFGPNDYTELGLPIPLSCYTNFNKTVNSHYHRGCLPNLWLMHSFNQAMEAISDWSIVALEAVSAFVAVLLAITLKNVQRRRMYSYY